MRKVYVLDTNVLLHDPRAIFKFEEHEVVVPIEVIEEIDNFKREMNELGRNSRMLTRFIDELRELVRRCASFASRAGCSWNTSASASSPVPSSDRPRANGSDERLPRITSTERRRVPTATEISRIDALCSSEMRPSGGDAAAAIAAICAGSAPPAGRSGPLGVCPSSIYDTV